MNTLRAAWIAAFLLFVPLMGTSLFTYSSQRKEKKKIESRIQNIKASVEALTEDDSTLEKLKKDGKAVLKRFNITKDNWWYLGDLEGIKGKYRPVFKNISRSKVSEGPNFTKLSRLVNMSGTFSEALDLIGNLEDSGDFQIEDLRISTDKTDNKKHEMEFWLSFMRIKEDVVKKLSDAIEGKSSAKKDKKYHKRSLRFKPRWKKGERLILKKSKRDPFVDLKKRREAWLAQIKEEQQNLTSKQLLAKELRSKGKSKENAPLPPLDISLKLVLKGVLSLKGTKMAILDAKFEVIASQKNLYRYNVRIGDFVGDKKVTRIEDKRVTLKSGKRTYYTVMP